MRQMRFVTLADFIHAVSFLKGRMGLLILALLVSLALPSLVIAQNIISNGDFEQAGSGGNPLDWSRGRWGTNTATFTYPSEGVSEVGARVELTSRTSGDAKWAFKDVSVEPGATYRYTDSYKSTVPTFITAEFTLNDGSKAYKDLAQPSAASGFTSVNATFVPPPNAKAVTIFHLINQVGSLTIDSVSVEKIGSAPPPPPPPSPSNLISNPSLETGDATGNNPLKWARGRWGTNTATFTYPSEGHTGARAAKVSLSNYTSGDAKWFFERIPATGGKSYIFSNEYRSNTTSYVTVEFTLSNGGTSYLDLEILPASGGLWKNFQDSFTAPATAVSLTIYHLIKSTGTLEVDNYVLQGSTTAPPPPSPTAFDKAYFTLTFDDGRRSTYDIGLPIVEREGYKSTHFIISGRMNANFPGYLQPNEIRDIHNRGHEIAAHTRTHPDLTQLTQSEMVSEISGSKSDLLGIGIPSVVSFAYPFGAYNSTARSVVSESGFTGARTTTTGTNTITQNRYELLRVSGDNTSLASLKATIDQAIAQKKWLIFAFHDVSDNGGPYSVSPATLSGVVSYLKEKNATVITMRQGNALLSSTP